MCGAGKSLMWDLLVTLEGQAAQLSFFSAHQHFPSRDTSKEVLCCPLLGSGQPRGLALSAEAFSPAQLSAVVGNICHPAKWGHLRE